MNKQKALKNNDLNWYVVTYANGKIALKHRSQLTAILDCGKAMEDYGIKEIEQCWNGEDLS